MKTLKQLEKERKELEKAFKKAEKEFAKAEEKRRLEKERRDMKKNSGVCWAVFFKGKPYYIDQTEERAIRSFLHVEDSDTRDGGWGWEFYEEHGHSVKKIKWKIVK